MNLGTYSWINKGILTSTGVEADSPHPTEMEYKDAISYNENKGSRNANIIFSLNNDPDGWNSDNIKWNDEIGIVELTRYKDGVEDLSKTMNGGNWIDISLEDQSSYIYEFKIEFTDGNYAYYSVQINNNMKCEG